ncbi:hypothetical protein ADUPG1_005819, partial [Aduncisulcus paluster]
MLTVQTLVEKLTLTFAAAKAIPFDDSRRTLEELIGLNLLDQQNYPVEEILDHYEVDAI